MPQAVGLEILPMAPLMKSTFLPGPLFRPPRILQTGDVVAVAVAEDIEVVDVPGQLMSEKLPIPPGLALISDAAVAEMS